MYIKENNKECLYRVHNKPDHKKIEEGGLSGKPLENISNKINIHNRRENQSKRRRINWTPKSAKK